MLDASAAPVFRPGDTVRGGGKVSAVAPCGADRDRTDYLLNAIQEVGGLISIEASRLRFPDPPDPTVFFGPRPETPHGDERTPTSS